MNMMTATGLMKKTPGAGDAYMVYDVLDRLVFTQDANLRGQNQWLTTLYDALDRPVITGLTTYNAQRSDLQQLVTTQTSSGNVSGLPSSLSLPATGYSGTYSGDFRALSSITMNAGFATTTGGAFSAAIAGGQGGQIATIDGQSINNNPLPANVIFSVLTNTFYDNYSGITAYGSQYGNKDNSYDSYLNAASNNTWPYPQSPTQSNGTLGLITGAKINVLTGTARYLYTAYFYDDRNRIIQTKSSNISGGLDISTSQYSFNGRTLMTVQNQGQAGANAQTNLLLSRLTYDDLERTIKTEKMMSNSLLNGGSLPTVWTTTAEAQYNALGQVKTKTLGKQKDASGNYTATPIESLAYEYNIRGWLLGINRAYLSSGSTSSSYFGMELNYDKDGYAPNGSKQYTGNIGAMVWRSEGDGMPRQFQYSYDNLNRLLKGDFTQWDGGSWNNSNANFNVKLGDGVNPLSAYDANGNILRLQQWGLKVGGSAQIDDLTYGYSSNSNKLLTVTDAITADNKMGDFTDKNTSGSDYGYDKNGNLVTDLNKSISGSTGVDLTSGGAITYNYMDLPQVISVSGKGTISYVYDAAGGKLQKVTSETGATVPYNGTNYTSDIITTTTYALGMVYESKAYSNNSLSTLQYTDKLQFLNQEEGRIRALNTNTALPNVPTGLAYDYFIKDHVGNVRMVLTEEQQKDIYPAATLEGDPANSSTAAGYELLFYTINSSNIVSKSAATGITDYVNNNGISSVYPTGNSGNTNINNNSQKLYRLNNSSSKTGWVSR